MRIGTLFSGIGAPEQGAKRVYDDLEMVFACEWDKFARQSFESNYDIAADHFHKDINETVTEVSLSGNTTASSWKQSQRYSSMRM